MIATYEELEIKTNMLAILGFVLVLGPLILFHEFGHFITAKLSGVRVEEFGLGWPPRLFKFWTSPTRMTVNGAVIETPRNFDRASNLENGQYVEVVTGPKSDGVYQLERLRVLDANTDDVTPKREMIDQKVHMRGQLSDLDQGTIYSLNWIPLGGFCRMTGEEDPSDPRSLAAQPKRERLLVLTGGALTNLILAVLLFSLAFMSGVPSATKTHVAIMEVTPGSPAAEAGLQSGDIILKAGGEDMADANQLVDYINAHAGETATLTIERNGEVLQKQVHIRAQRVPEGRVGIRIYDQGYAFETRYSSFFESIGQGFEQFWLSFKQLLQLPAMLIRGQVSPQEVKPVGPVGISQWAGDAIERSSEQNSWFTILYFAGAISMALGVSNLLPLPALDGGRIVFVLIEAIRGRRIDPAKEGLVHLIGMAVLLGLMLLITIQELVNPLSSPF
jgi:regulator of sigma E protease